MAAAFRPRGGAVSRTQSLSRLQPLRPLPTTPPLPALGISRPVDPRYSLLRTKTRPVPAGLPTPSAGATTEADRAGRPTHWQLPTQPRSRTQTVLTGAPAGPLPEPARAPQHIIQRGATSQRLFSREHTVPTSPASPGVAPTYCTPMSILYVGNHNQVFLLSAWGQRQG